MGLPVSDDQRRQTMSFAEDLHDALYALAEDGRPVIVPDPGTEHGRALVKALGAEIESQDAICTRDANCRALADAHQDDCPVELKLREELGF